MRRARVQNIPVTPEVVQENDMELFNLQPDRQADYSVVQLSTPKIIIGERGSNLNVFEQSSAGIKNTSAGHNEDKPLYKDLDSIKLNDIKPDQIVDEEQNNQVIHEIKKSGSVVNPGQSSLTSTDQYDIVQFQENIYSIIDFLFYVGAQKKKKTVAFHSEPTLNNKLKKKLNEVVQKGIKCKRWTNIFIFMSICFLINATQIISIYLINAAIINQPFTTSESKLRRTIRYLLIIMNFLAYQYEWYGIFQQGRYLKSHNQCGLLRYLVFLIRMGIAIFNELFSVLIIQKMSLQVQADGTDDILNLFQNFASLQIIVQLSNLVSGLPVYQQLRNQYADNFLKFRLQKKSDKIVLTSCCCCTRSKTCKIRFESIVFYFHMALLIGYIALCAYIDYDFNISKL